MVVILRYLHQSLSPQERPAARVSLEVAIEGGNPLAMHGLSTTMQGQTFHIATVAGERSGNARKALDGILEEPDFKRTAEPGTGAGHLSPKSRRRSWEPRGEPIEVRNAKRNGVGQGCHRA